MSYFNLYTLGGKVFAELVITPWLYLMLCLLLVPLVYRVYRKKDPV